MKIFINNNSFNINPLKSIFSIKKELNLQNIYFNGKNLEDNKTFLHYHIKENSKLIEKKELKGGSATRVVSIIIGVLLLLLFIGNIFLGTIPLFGMILSNVLVKGAKVLAEFTAKLLDPNNWIRSFLLFFANTIIPFFGVVFFYISVFMLTFLLTFWCVYFIYFGVLGSVKGYNAANGLAILSSFFMLTFYFMFDSPVMISKFIIGILKFISKKAPGLKFLSYMIGWLKKLILKVISLRVFVLGLIPFYGQFAMTVLTVVRYFFIGLRTIQSLGVSFFQNWEMIYNMTQTYPMADQIQEMGVQPIIELVNWAMLPTDEKRQKPKSPEMASISYLIKFIYFNSLAFFIGTIQYYDVCGNQSDLQELLEDELGDLRTASKSKELMMKELNKGLNKIKQSNPNQVNNDGEKVLDILSEKKDEVQQQFTFITRQIGDVTKKLKEAGDKKLLDVDCLMNIIETTMLGAPLFFIFFLILFILLFIMPNMLNFSG